jgi:hypothetical protein
VPDFRALTVGAMRGYEDMIQDDLKEHDIEIQMGHNA